MGAQVTVDVDFRKWKDRPHYRFVAEQLGKDGAADYQFASSERSIQSGLRR